MINTAIKILRRQWIFWEEKTMIIVSYNNFVFPNNLDILMQTDHRIKIQLLPKKTRKLKNWLLYSLNTHLINYNGQFSWWWLTRLVHVSSRVS